MAIEKPPLNMSQDSGIDIEIMDMLQGQAPEESMGMEVQLPEEMNIQGDMTSAFEIGADGNVIPMFEQEEVTITDHQANLAETLDSSDLSTLASELLEAYDSDKESRQDWLDTFTNGLDLLGIKTEEREDPFPGATGVHHPLLAEAVTQFQAQSYKELLPPGGPVKTRIMGAETPEVTDQNQRVKEFMNYQITEVMKEYDPEMDSLLFYLPLAGSAFKKIYYDNLLGRATSRLVKAENLVVAYETVDLETSPRFTHSMTMTGNDLKKLQMNGTYREADIGEASLDMDYNEAKEKMDELQGISPSMTDYDEYSVLEMHVNLELSDEEDYGYAVPYVVTILEEQSEILAIRRNWEAEDELFRKKEYFTHYKFLPGLGFYGFGLIHMIGGLTKSATSILRQLVDAGTLSNLPAGFKARGMRIQGEDEPLRPGEFRDVDVPGGIIRDALMPLPYKEPSNVLSQLLGTIIDSGRRFASIADMNVGDIGSQQLPVGTTVAMLERGTKVMSAIHKRMHYAQKKEFRMLANIFAKSLPPVYPYEVPGASREIKATDFDAKIDIIPVSDPNIFSMAQRVMLAQQELEMARAAPEIHDLREAYRRMYEALEVKNIDGLLPPQAEVPARDPITEQQSALTGQPIQAYVFQNHDAYIASHTAFLQNPMVQQNQSATIAVQANIQEHQAMKYRQQIEQVLGQPLPQMGEGEMPPEIMNQIAAQAAQATQQVTGQEQALIEAQQIQAQAAQTQPLVELKQAEIQQKAQSDQMKAEVDMMKQQSTEAIAEMKIAQQREDSLIKEKGLMRKDYRDILKDVRDSDNKTKGV
tara:strand:- start:3063 stop:5504 length:2442 start_codon:yes stop_codon:yes gene_type:complete